MSYLILGISAVIGLVMDAGFNVEFAGFYWFLGALAGYMCGRISREDSK